MESSSPRVPIPHAAPTPKVRKLRALLQKPGLHQVPDAFDVMTAGIAEALGFEALYTGGQMIAAMNLGILDWGLVTTTELIEYSSRIADAISIPVIADADQGGETALNVYRAVKEFERRGIAGVHIEDTCNPKHAGNAAHLQPTQLRPDARDLLQPLDEMLVRVSAAVDAKTDPDFVIIARTDALFYKLPLDEAIRRAVAFEQAGADAVFVVVMQPHEIDQIAKELSVPLIGLNYPSRSVEHTALKLNLWAVKTTTAVLHTYMTLLEHLKAEGDMLDPPQVSPSAYELGFGQLAHAEAYSAIAERWRAVHG